MKILVVDDERVQREILRDILHDEGYTVVTADSGTTAIQLLNKEPFGVILTDLKMPGKDGLDVLNAALQIKPPPQVVIMTAFGSIPGAVAAIKQGAYDYLTKPFQKDDLVRVISRATEKWQLLTENRRLQTEVEDKYSYRQIIGKSPAIEKVFALIDRIKDVDATCLITGESGTGKELVARAIHFSGQRKKGPFIAINCGAIPENLIESELFGHLKGSFTGAVNNKTGSFVNANNGTIFLDEIGTMKADLQVKLLRVIEEKKVTPVGGSRPVSFDARIIAATNIDLMQAVEKSDFRMDLYHRLNVFSIKIPPLRKREGDIPLLANHFIRKYCRQYEKNIPKIEKEALVKLERYSFPGNIRELENLIERHILLYEKETISAADLIFEEEKEVLPELAAKTGQQSLPLIEKKLIEQTLTEKNGSIKHSAEALGVSYKTLQYRLKKYGINKSNFKL